MNRQSETTIKTELELLLKKLQEYGITLPHVTITTDLSVDDSRRVRNLAWRIVQGDIDPEEIAELSKRFPAELNNMVQQIISLRDSETLKQLEETNPYYDASPAKIVRDSATKGR